MTRSDFAPCVIASPPWFVPVVVSEPVPVIVVVGYVFGKLAGSIVRAVVGRIVKRTRSTWDDELLKRLAGPVSAALGLACGAALVPFTGIPDNAGDFAYKVIRASYGFVFFWAMFRVVENPALKPVADEADARLRAALGAIARATP